MIQSDPANGRPSRAFKMVAMAFGFGLGIALLALTMIFK